MTVVADSYDDLDATALAELVRKGEASPLELVDAAIDRIRRRNPQVNAVIYEAFDRARRCAREPLPEGPFQGVPFLLKDILAAWEDAPLTHGSRFFGDWTPPRNSMLVDRFLASGVVVVGKTNLPEFALLPLTQNERFGATRNPWDRTRTPGGSSGGAAAAVAARMVPMASAGDGGGSIRMPASCCGLFGFKPGRGRNPIGPYLAEVWDGCSEEHVITRSVRDSAAMLDATCGPAPGERYALPKPERPFVREVGQDPGRLRIAFTVEPQLGRNLHPDCRAALDDACKLLQSLGHDVVEAAPKIDPRAFRSAYGFMLAGTVAADIRAAERLVGRKATARDFEGTTWLLRVLGEALTAGEHRDALNALRAIGRGLGEFVAGYDAWLTPTLAAPPIEIGTPLAPRIQLSAGRVLGRLGLGRLALGEVAKPSAIWNFMPFTALANVGGLPSMNVPLFWNAQRLPIGVTFTGGARNEALLFRLAAQLERERPWSKRCPPGLELRS